MTLYLQNWYDKLLAELERTKHLKIISPFVKEQVIRTIQSRFDFKNFELITRFSLSDYASKVSSLPALKFSLECGASIYGVKNLHSKVYIFDKRAAIITSANLTSGGLVNNYECGIYITDIDIINQLLNYFNSLKLGDKLTVLDCEKWEAKLSKVEIINTSSPSLPDYGASALQIDKERTYYVKFFGTSVSREPLDYPVADYIKDSYCHYACGFSIKKKPQQIKDGDIIYMACMTREPHDYAIFGKAEAIKYVEGRDQATDNEISQLEWKEKWPIYLRVKNPVFINGAVGDGILLYDLIKALGYESFPSTQKRYEEDGERNINPYLSLSRHAYVKLTHKAVEWLEPRFQESLKRKGQIEQDFIDDLPQSDINIDTWGT